LPLLVFILALGPLTAALAEIPNGHPFLATLLRFAWHQSEGVTKVLSQGRAEAASSDRLI
jgi:hypothetical protein